MATIEELRAALARLEQGNGRGGIPVRPTDDDQLLWAALNELAEARPVVVAAEQDQKACHAVFTLSGKNVTDWDALAVARAHMGSTRLALHAALDARWASVAYVRQSRGGGEENDNGIRS